MADKLPSMNFKTSDFISPKESMLMWVFITPPGKKNLQDKMCFNAALYVKTDSEECKKFKEALNDFWDDNKPKGAKLKSLGFRDEMEEDDKGVDVPTGFTSFNFWTGAKWPDGKYRIMDIYGAKGNKISLGDKKIGNKSKGAIAGVMQLYDNGPAARGITLFLNAIQVTEFIEYSNDPHFGKQEGEFDGVTSEFDGVTDVEPDGVVSGPSL